MNTKNRYYDILFFIAWGLYSAALVLQQTETYMLDENGLIGLMVTGLRYLSYLIGLIVICLKWFRKSWALAALAAIAVTAVSAFLGDSRVILYYLIFFIGAYSIRGAKIIKVSFWSRAVLLFLIISFSLIGLLNDHMFVSGDRVRHGLGFGWTTTGAILYLFLVWQYIYMRREKLRIAECAVIVFIGYMLFKYTDSKMAFAMTVVTVLFFAIQHLNRKRWRFLRKLKYIYVTSPFLCAILSIIAFYKYDWRNPHWNALNRLLSDRLQLGQNAIHQYGWRPFGQDVEWIGYSVVEKTEAYNYVDCSYLQIGISYGYLFLLLVLMIYSLIIWKAIKRNDYYLVWTILFILIFSLTEPRLFNLMYNPFPLLLLANMKKYDSLWKERHEQTRNVD